MYKIQRLSVAALHIIAVIVCAMVVMAEASTRNEHELDRAIQEALKERNCYKAGELIKEAARRDQDNPHLPDWYYGLSQCSKADPSGFRLLIKEFFNRRIEEIATRQSCSESERYARAIDAKFRSSGNYPAWLFSAARCYEKAGVRDKALPIYREITRDFKNSDSVIEAQFRINWLTGDRSWLFKKEGPLLKAVMDAIRNLDSKALGRYASKSMFYWGYFEQSRPTLFSEGPQAELERAFKSSKPLLGELVYKSPTVIYLQVVFSQEEFPLWYFWFWNEEGGWQWTGVSIQPETGK